MPRILITLRGGTVFSPGFRIVLYRADTRADDPRFTLTLSFARAGNAVAPRLIVP
ncbi:MAG TPA: hypothetical protein VFZ29_04480 [Solirubrobacterales bacterium]